MRVLFARAALLGTAAAAVLIATPAFAQENSSSNPNNRKRRGKSGYRPRSTSDNLTSPWAALSLNAAPFPELSVRGGAD